MLKGDLAVALSSQILAEVYAVVTNPRRVSPALTPEQAVADIRRLRNAPGVQLVSVPDGAVDRWLGLPGDRPVTAGRIFDLQIVATMQEHGILRIATFNDKDFTGFEGIEVVVP